MNPNTLYQSKLVSAKKVSISAGNTYEIIYDLTVGQTGICLRGLPGIKISVYKKESASDQDYRILIKEAYGTYLMHDTWLSFKAEAQSYRIALQSIPSNKSGEAILQIYKLYLNGAELANRFNIYNDPNMVLYNNCYTYAMDIDRDPKTHLTFRKRGQNPGELSRQNWPLAAPFKDSDADTILKLVNDDLAEVGRDIKELTNDYADNGYYKIAFILAPNDYHWYRQTDSGLWVHKPGITPAKYIDDLQNAIIEPENCEHGKYRFIGYYQVKKKSVDDLNASISMAIDKQETTMSYEHREVTQADIDKISVGMFSKEVYKLLGAPHAVSGYGMIDDIYYPTDSPAERRIKYDGEQVFQII